MRQMLEDVLGSVEGIGYLHTASYESIHSRDEYSHTFIQELIHSHRGIPDISLSL